MSKVLKRGSGGGVTPIQISPPGTMSQQQAAARAHMADVIGADFSGKEHNSYIREMAIEHGWNPFDETYSQSKSKGGSVEGEGSSPKHRNDRTKRKHS